MSKSVTCHTVSILATAELHFSSGQPWIVQVVFAFTWGGFSSSPEPDLGCNCTQGQSVSTHWSHPGRATFHSVSPLTEVGASRLAILPPGFLSNQSNPFFLSMQGASRQQLFPRDLPSPTHKAQSALCAAGSQAPPGGTTPGCRRCWRGQSTLGGRRKCWLVWFAAPFLITGKCRSVHVYKSVCKIAEGIQ